VGPARSAPHGSWAVGFDGTELLGQLLGGGSGAVDLAGGRFDARAVSFEGGLQGSAWWDTASGAVGGQLRWPQMSLAVLGDQLAGLAGGVADLERLELPRDDRRPGASTPTAGTLRSTCSPGPKR
jgi:hypothetical protein